MMEACTLASSEGGAFVSVARGEDAGVECSVEQFRLMGTAAGM